MRLQTIGSVLCVGLALAAPLHAEDTTCAQTGIVIQGAGESAPVVCAAAEIARDQLASCNLEVPHGLAIEVTQSLPANCYGLYHCDEDLIQVLPPESYETYLAAHPDSPFGHLSPQVFFNSILRHELTHAALEGMPCPFESCPASQEFVAYMMQIWFLSDEDRAPFDTWREPSGPPASRDGLNAMILMMAPDLFIERAYRFLSQQDDPCAMIDQVARGEILLDLPFH